MNRRANRTAHYIGRVNIDGRYWSLGVMSGGAPARSVAGFATQAGVRCPPADARPPVGSCRRTGVDRRLAAETPEPKSSCPASAVGRSIGPADPTWRGSSNPGGGTA
jgi:hypothetical protein